MLESTSASQPALSAREHPSLGPLGEAADVDAGGGAGKPAPLVISRTMAWLRAHPEKAKQYQARSRLWAKTHPEKGRAYTKVWRERNPEKVKQMAKTRWSKDHADPAKREKKKFDAKAWREANRDRIAEYKARLYQENRDVERVRHRERALQSKFGISIAEYDRRLAVQGDKCGICRRPQTQFKTRFAVDHDHETNQVRGLLCIVCNVRLGWLEAQSEETHATIVYLENWKLEYLIAQRRADHVQ